MTSPARRHFENRTAALKTEQGSGEDRTPANANQYELMLAKLAEDKRRLSAVQSMEKRAVLKLELLPIYDAWVSGVIEGNQGVQDDVLMTIMVWHIDAGNLAEAVKIAAYAIKHKLKMPDQYKRSTAVVIAEEIADYYLKAHAANKSLDTDLILTTMSISLNQDMPDEVKAKLHKVLGYAALVNETLVPDFLPDHAARLNYVLENFTRALELNEKVGVKKDIEAVQRNIKNLADTPE